ncbi:hypothetical protein F4861DRAFT_502489 [Xylaria intraflava]|nr:hypothetical protein F4861DRAFT_502489 [Xylaria intraflava]
MKCIMHLSITATINLVVKRSPQTRFTAALTDIQSHLHFLLTITMSGFSRNFWPLGLAVIFGIGNGYYAFQPVLKEQHEKSKVSPEHGQQSGSASGDAISK